MTGDLRVGWGGVEGGLGRGWLRVVPVENSLEDSRNVVPSGRQRGAGGGIELV